MTRLVVIFVGGLLFGFGLAVSNMVEQEIVLGFVQLRDLGLGVTMAGALVITAPIYQLAARLRPRPPLGADFERFPRRVTARNVVGGVVFGIGWGLSGVCPGSAIASIGVGNWPILAAVAGMLLGAYLQGAVMSRSVASQATPSA
jgi:uncharacterized membrane protein YedE/YeeE